MNLCRLYDTFTSCFNIFGYILKIIIISDTIIITIIHVPSKLDVYGSLQMILHDKPVSMLKDDRAASNA